MVVRCSVVDAFPRINDNDASAAVIVPVSVLVVSLYSSRNAAPAAAGDTRKYGLWTETLAAEVASGVEGVVSLSDGWEGARATLICEGGTRPTVEAPGGPGAPESTADLEGI